MKKKSIQQFFNKVEIFLKVWFYGLFFMVCVCFGMNQSIGDTFLSNFAER